ncbi:MAG: hemolysin family protein [Candidatus Aminicenantes bacterium]|nr:hemolysin family protein [Candidatus Aminicenantes bacterium]
MLLASILLFAVFLILSAFFSSSETAFIGSNPYTLDYLEKKGSKRAGAVKRILARLDDFLATVLIGNTLVNAAAASVATSLFVSFIPDRETAVLLATIVTTLFILFFSEINPKIYAAYNPLKISFVMAKPIRAFMILFYPFVKVFTFLSSLLFPSTERGSASMSRAITEDETKVLLSTGIKGISAFRKKMIAEILDIASRPVKEIMTPRPQIKAIEIGATRQQILDAVLGEEFSRFPVFRGRLDHIEGLIHTKDIIPYLTEAKDFDLSKILRKPFFVPESASVEKVLIQMKENAVHLAFVVDEFGNMEGIVTLEDIIEEVVGEIRDEYDAKEEEWFAPAGENAFLIKGAAGIKDINERLALELPESGEYTTLAGFFLYEFGRIPRERDALTFEGRRFAVEKMNKRHISLIRVDLVHG